MITGLKSGRAVAHLLLLLGLLWNMPALAQSVTLPVPPDRSSVDSRGVDLPSGGVQMSDPQLSIGTAGNGLVHTRYWPGLAGWRHGYMISAAADASNHVTITIGGSSTGFTLMSGVYSSDQGDGATLIEDSSSYTYTGRDGTTVYFDKSFASFSTSYYGAVSALGTVITPPTGLKTYLTYKKTSYSVTILGSSITFYAVRLQSVTTSSGFQFKYTYATNTLNSTTVNAWVQITNVAAINNAVDYCDPTADACTGLTQTWPSVSYSVAASGSNTVETVTDAAGRAKSYTTNSAGKLVGIRRPSASSDNLVYAYDSNNRVSSVAISGVGTWTYAFTTGTGTITATITTPTVPTSRVVVSDTNVLQPLTITDENGYTSTFTYDVNGRLHTATGAGSGSNYTTYYYDGRGNLTSTVGTPQSSSGLGTLTTSASYPLSCAVAATCNKPTTSTDTAGKVTNYYYNSNGTSDYVQSPAPTSGAARPEVHFSYGNAQAWLKNSSGSVVLQPDVVNLPTGSTTCVTGAWPCAAANQVVKALAYYGGPSATNMLLESTTVKSGSGSPSATSSYGYDNIGNVISVTDPVGNITPYYYDADRLSLGYRSPSLDGSSTSIRPAVVYHYNSDGLRDSISYGSVVPASSTFTARKIAYTGYDGAGRKTLDGLSDGTTTVALTQYSYNGAGRLDCVAQRMNPATFGSLPGSACTLGTAGSNGQDRITHYIWEYAGALDRTQSAYGLGLQRDDVHYTHTLHGQVETMTDAKGNVTSYSYDGFDRLLRTCYNTALASCNDSAPDIVKLTYDSAGRLTNRGLRGHSLAITIGYSYDDLMRVTHVAYPGGGAFDQPVDYVYDNLGRVLSATDAGTHTAIFAYDALGNVTNQGDAISSRTMQYDADGRRTRLTWADSRYVTYEYDGASDLTAIRESGTTALATFAYDDIGRRASLTRGNGVVTTYSYDSLGLTSLANDLNGTAYDQTLGFTHNAAGQIITKTSSNDVYAWTGHYNVNRNYTSNGLNQYTASGSVTPTYDDKANLASAGGSTYAYSTKNELVNTSDTGTQFYHDPLGRLDSILGAPSGNTGFQYDGDEISTEFTATSPYPLLRRYVYGPDDDEPLVWYEGSDFSDKRWLIGDERGSVTAVTDSSGNPIQINSYDEYGIPASTNMGRLQYTGQAWIPELGMYSYKARIYSPTLGRFLQPDPAGYPDGPNNYNYAVSDPINGRDPSGMDDDGFFFNPAFFPDGGGGVFGDIPSDPGDITVIGSLPSNSFDLPPLDIGGALSPDVGGVNLGGVNSGSSSKPASSAAGDIIVMARHRAAAPSASNVMNIGGDAGPQNADAALSPGQIDDIVVTAAKKHSVGGITVNFNLPFPQEQLWVLYGVNDIAYLGISGKAKGSVGENKGTPPRPGYQAIIHTHPSWADYGPGPKDYGKSVPLYGIAPDGVWVIRPGATSATGLYGLRP